MKGNGRGGVASVKGVSQRAVDSGWREGTVQEFLGLSDEAAALIRVKAGLAVMLQRRRRDQGWSQAMLAERLGSGQSRVAKMEAAHPSVSLDLLVKGLLVAGATMTDIGAVMATGDPNATASAKQREKKRTRRNRRAATSK